MHGVISLPNVTPYDNHIFKSDSNQVHSFILGIQVELVSGNTCNYMEYLSV